MSTFLRAELDALNGALPEIESTFLFSADGVVIKSSLRDELSNNMGAAFAALNAVGFRVSGLLEMGEFSQIQVQCEEKALILSSIADEFILAVLLDSAADIRHISAEIRQSCEAISEHLISGNDYE